MELKGGAIPKDVDDENAVAIHDDDTFVVDLLIGHNNIDAPAHPGNAFSGADSIR